MKNKKNSRKFMAAMAIGVLVLSGLAINVAAMDENNIKINSLNASFKDLKNNPYDLIKATNISIPSNFDYLDQMNKEFVDNIDSNDKIGYMPGDFLRSLEKDNDN